MPALTQDRPTPEREGRLLSDPIAASAVIYAGAMYALDEGGNAIPAAPGAPYPVRGVARRRCDQPAGDELVDGIVGVFCFDNSAGAGEIKRVDIGGPCVVVDDQTVAKGDAGCKAGVVFDVDERGVWVRVGV